MRRLPYQCPECQRKLAPVASSEYATQVVLRTCSRCHTRWQIVVKPIRTIVGWMDVGTFTKKENI